jgi:hypothetical protein
MTTPVTLARVRALAPVAALAELWQRRPDESPAEYETFMGWLDAGETRGSPGDPGLAQRHEWAERALAYERASSLAASEAGRNGATTPEATIVSNLTRMVQLETDKLLRQSAQSPQPVVGVKDLVAVMGLVQELHDKGTAASAVAASTAALEGLTTDEKRAILKYQLLQRKQK